MKPTFAFLYALLTTSVCFAAPNITHKTINVISGSSAYCESEADLHRNRHGAYKAFARLIEIKENYLLVELTINFLKCSLTEDGYAYTPMNADEPITYDFNNGLETLTITNKALETTLQVYQDGEYKVLAEEKLGAESTQSLILKLPMNNIFSTNEIEKYNKGIELKSNFDMWIRKTIELKVKDQPKHHDIFNVPFGSFRVHFTIEI